MIRLKVPLLSESFYNKDAAKMNKTALQNIRRTYSQWIEGAAYLCNVPSEIITAIIFLESGGKPALVSSAGAVGLMQLKPFTANDTIWLENSKNRLTSLEKTLIRKYIGIRLDALLQMKYLNHKLKVNNYSGNVISKNDLTHPYFNVLIGTMLIGLLIDQATTNDQLKFENALLRYNQGYFFVPKGNNIHETMAFLKGRTEAYNYVLKMVGKNGLMETILS